MQEELRTELGTTPHERSKLRRGYAGQIQSSRIDGWRKIATVLSQNTSVAA